MQAKLYCKTGELAGGAFQIGDEATIGKNAGNTIQLSPATISGNHARIYFDKKANCYCIEDLKSRNGTRVNGMRVTGAERLSNLNIITFARKFDFIFQQVEDEPAKRNVEPEVTPVPKSVAEKIQPQPPDAKRKTIVGEDFTPVPRLREEKENMPMSEPRGKTVIGDDFSPVPKLGAEKIYPETPDLKQKTIVGDEFAPLPQFDKTSIEKPPSEKPAPESVQLVFQLAVDLNGENKLFTLKEGENNVGRSPNNDIMIDDPSMSRTHAVLIQKGGVVTVKDLGSKNHTFVDNQRVLYEVELRPGNTVTFGLVYTIFQKK